MLKKLHVSLQQAPAGHSRYAILATALRARVIDGEWTPGSALPSEQVLALEHGVALGTMRRALELLVEQGLIERVHGRGTFVRTGLAGATMLRFFRFGEGAGQAPQSCILSRQQVAASALVARQLGCAPGEPVLRLHRLRMLSNQPCLLEDICLPLPMFDPLLEMPLSTWDDLLYPMYAKHCGVHVLRAVDEISFAALTTAQAKPLELPVAHPCAMVERLAYDLSGRCVEYRVTRGDANAFRYTVTLT